jgi:hypothetical protein
VDAASLDEPVPDESPCDATSERIRERELSTDVPLRDLPHDGDEQENFYVTR